MWPAWTTFNLTDTAIFIFLQDDNAKIPKIPCNINLFSEKCTKAKFRFISQKESNDPTLSLGEKYFRGRCGRTMIIMKETVENFNIIILAAAAKTLSSKQLDDVKKISASYRSEAEKYVRDRKAAQSGSHDTGSDNKSDNQSDQSADHGDQAGDQGAQAADQGGQTGDQGT
jgi:hypothetical protein